MFYFRNLVILFKIELPATLDKNKCCIPGCTNRISKRHRFPNPKDMDMFNTWVDILTQPHLKNMEPEKIYKSYYICNTYFSPEYSVPGTDREA